MTPEPLTTWDSRLRRVGSLVLRHGVTCAVGGALALLLAGELLDWRREQEPVRRVVTVRPTSRLADAELVRIPADLVVPVIPGRTLTRLERDYATGPLATVVPSGDIVGSSGSTLSGGLADAELVLGEFRLPRLPEGGGALVTREPGGEVSLVVKPEARPFFGLRSEWAVGAMVAPADPAGEWRGYVRWSGLRVGRVHVVAEGGAQARAGASSAYALVGAEVRF